MKIYTRAGDRGESRLFGGTRVKKSAARLHAYGTVDELNAVLGLLLSHEWLPAEMRSQIERIQSDLFIVGADLATQLTSTAKTGRIGSAPTTLLEQWIDAMEATLPPLSSFIVPGGSIESSTLHVARTVCRRAERWIVTLGQEEPLSKHLLPYINRLSDYLFVAARCVNASLGVEDSAVTIDRV